MDLIEVYLASISSAILLVLVYDAFGGFHWKNKKPWNCDFCIIFWASLLSFVAFHVFFKGFTIVSFPIVWISSLTLYSRVYPR